MKPENVKCPKCDGPMTPRSSSYGEDVRRMLLREDTK